MVDRVGAGQVLIGCVAAKATARQGRRGSDQR
jgi:hypothetical protein